MELKPTSPVLAICRLLSREKRSLHERVYEVARTILDKKFGAPQNQKKP